MMRFQSGEEFHSMLILYAASLILLRISLTLKYLKSGVSYLTKASGFE